MTTRRSGSGDGVRGRLAAADAPADDPWERFQRDL